MRAPPRLFIFIFGSGFACHTQDLVTHIVHEIISDDGRSTKSTMFKQKSELLLTNGNGKLMESREEETSRLWPKIHINEWTFSLSLFIFSLSIVLGKLCVNYGKHLSWQSGDQFTLPSITWFTQMYNTIDMPSVPDLPKFDMKQLSASSEKFVNASNYYTEAIINVLVIFYEKYGWLIKAMTSGLLMTGFTWFIIYNDSSIPGINPPFPFSSSRQRMYGASRIQMNYLVGLLNGILLFIYMCF